MRRDYGITVVGIKRGSRAFPYATPDTVVVPGDLIIISGDRAQVERFASLA